MLFILSQQDHTFTHNAMFLKQPQRPSNWVAGTLMQAAEQTCYQRLSCAQKLRRGQQKKPSMQVKNGPKIYATTSNFFRHLQLHGEWSAKTNVFCKLMF